MQLFNAVSKHQKEVEAKLKEAGNSERKKIKGMPERSKEMSKVEMYNHDCV